MLQIDAEMQNILDIAFSIRFWSVSKKLVKKSANYMLHLRLLITKYLVPEFSKFLEHPLLDQLRLSKS